MKSIPKSFWRTVCSQFISNLADRGSLVIFMWWITAEIDSNLLIPFLFISLLPHLGGVFFSEKIIRKLGPIKVAIISDTIKALVLLALSFTLLTSHSPPSFMQLCIVSIISNLGSCLFNPAIMSIPVYISSCSMEKQKMSSSLSLSFSLAILTGPLLATFLLKTHSYFIPTFLLSASYITAVFNNVLGRYFNFDIKNRIHNTNKLIWSEHKNILYLLACFCLLNLFFVPIQSFIPLYTKYILKGGSNTFVALEAALGLGSIVGCLLLIKKSIRISTGAWLLCPFALASLAYVSFSLSTRISESMITLILLGIGLSLGNILAINYYQTRVCQDFVPSVMVWVNAISVAVGPVAMVMCGFVENHLGLMRTMILYSSLMLFVSLGIIFVKFFEKGVFTYEQI